MGGSKTLLTLEEFERLSDREGTARELDEGELTVMTPGRPRHNRIRDRIARRLMEFAEAHGLGEVFVETEFQLAHDTVRIPDAAFVPADRMKKVDLDRAIDGAPALAIEVVSPNDLAEDLARKVDQYVAAGARSVWVLYPKTREVHVFGPGGTARTLGEQELLGDDVLFPGFSVSVGALFEWEHTDLVVVWESGFETTLTIAERPMEQGIDGNRDALGIRDVVRAAISCAPGELSFLADVERGKGNISVLNLDLFANGFKLSLSQLLSKL